MIKKAIVIFFALLSTNGFSYVVNKGISGNNIKWSTLDNVLIRANTQNSYGFTDDQVKAIFNHSIGQWNQNSNKKIIVNYNNGPIDSAQNNLYFSKDSVFFESSGIAAVTQVSYKEEDGTIIKADIIVNDDLVDNPYTASTSDAHYLGNAFSHELGHFLGLSHSQVFQSTMFFKLKRGQHNISPDDRGGAIAHYGKLNHRDYSLQGKIVGGKSLIGIFGAHVEAISQKTGQVVAGSLSDQDGTFKIFGLSKNDYYSVYVSPLDRLDTLPLYYASVKNNFCDSSKSFRGSFYTNCQTSGIGHPQIIYSMNAESTNIGNVTVRCSQNTPVGYLASKGDYDYELNMVNQEGTELQLGHNFVGHFTNSEATRGEPDYLVTKFNYYDISSDPALAGKNLFYHIKTVTQSLRSKVYLSLEVEGAYSQFPDALPRNPDFLGLQYDQEGNPRIEVNEYVPLVINDPEIRIKVTPKDPLTFQTELNSRELYEEVFPGISDGIHDDMLFYNLIVDVVELNTLGEYVSVRPRFATYVDDNSYCSDATHAYSVGGRVISSSNTTSDLNRNKGADSSPLACGTVDFDNASGPGPQNGLMIVAFLFLFMLIKHGHLSSERN